MLHFFRVLDEYAHNAKDNDDLGVWWQNLPIENKRSIYKSLQPNGNCIHCNTPKRYSDKHDAYYCPKCLYWLEAICPDRECMFCKDRPRYPGQDQK